MTLTFVAGTSVIIFVFTVYTGTTISTVSDRSRSIYGKSIKDINVIHKLSINISKQVLEVFLVLHIFWYSSFIFLSNKVNNLIYQIHSKRLKTLPTSDWNNDF